MAETVKKHQIIINYDTPEEAVKELKSEQRKFIGTRTFDVLRPVVFRSEELVAINEQYFNECDFSPSAISPLGFVFSETRHENLLGEQRIHDSLKRVALNVFGVTKNKNLTEEQLPQVQEAYQAFKDLYLRLYEERVSKIVKER